MSDIFDVAWWVIAVPWGVLLGLVGLFITILPLLLLVGMVVDWRKFK